MTLTPARTSVAFILASALLLAGCGGDDAEPTGGSADASSDAPSAAASSGSTDADAGTPALEKDTFYESIIKAQQEAGSYRSTSTTTAAGMSAVLELEATYDGDKLFGHAKSAAQSAQQIESVVADGVIYLKADGMGVPAGKWLKIDPADPANADSPFAALAGVADPELALQAMGDLAALELVGPERVDGVETSHYRATMLTEKYTELLMLPDDAADLLPPKLPFDMWVDADNRPVKFTLSFDVAGQRTESEQTYYDYGADIDVDVPADRDTVTPTDLGLSTS